jgi:hypothetical protein
LKSISNKKNNNNKMRNTSLLAAPAEPVIENDLPLDLSCNSRRRSEDEENDDVEFRSGNDRRSSVNGRMMDVKETDMRSTALSIGGPPSPPRSPTSDFSALSDLGYVAYHRQLMAMERQRQWLLEQQQQHQHAIDVATAAQQDAGGGENAVENAKDRDRSRRHYRIHRYQRHHAQRRNKTKNNEEGGDDDVGDNNQEEQQSQQLDVGGDDDLLIIRRRRRRHSPPLGYDDEDDEEDEEECLGSDAEEDSDDSSHQNPMDLGLANPKAYKKSLMKRYRKFIHKNKKNKKVKSKFIFFWVTFPSSLSFFFLRIFLFFWRVSLSLSLFFLICSLWRPYRVGHISPSFGRDPPLVWKVKSFLSRSFPHTHTHTIRACVK